MISPQLRTVDIDGLTLVMDLQTSAFYFFDEDASAMWRVLRDADGAADAARGALRSQDSLSRLVEKLDDFIVECESRGFLVSWALPHAVVRPRILGRGLARRRSFLAVRAWLTMLCVDIGLRRHGFAAVYQSLECAGGGDPAIELVASARRAFLRAENFYLRRRAPNDCLPRSLALYQFLQALGVPVVHRIGARRFPTFRCHAWVECGGRPIFDHPARLREYSVVATIQPATTPETRD